MDKKHYKTAGIVLLSLILISVTINIYTNIKTNNEISNILKKKGVKDE